jgi:hypothetical protein
MLDCARLKLEIGFERACDGPLELVQYQIPMTKKLNC